MKHAALAVTLIALVGVGYAWGRSEPTDAVALKYANATVAYEKAEFAGGEVPEGTSDKMTSAITEAAGSAVAARQIASFEVLRFNNTRSINGIDRANRYSSEQALRLQALEVQQNARIIELLEQLAAKK